MIAGFENMNISTIVDTLTCPITAEIMKDPVQGNDGQTYERAAILHALSIKKESPITRQYMTESNLTVNAAIRFLCDKYHAGELGSNDINNISRQVDISNYNIELQDNISKNSNNNIMLKFDINDESYPKDLTSGHLPQDIVIVIDRSGSMNSGAETKDDNNNNYESGLSNQDIANHSAKTVAKTLDANSRLSIIQFDNNVEVLFNLMNMTEINKSRALTQIDDIKPRCQTNIWGGIEEAIKILDNREDKSRNGAIIMLTDGIPNISPARGEVETLKKLRIKKNFTSPIYCFGFGYNLQRDLLYDLSKYANGSMGHIPDGSMIATVFCNFTATILTTVVVNLQLHIISNSLISNFNDFLQGDYVCNFDKQTNEYIYDIGTIQYQQSRNIILNTNQNSNFTYYYTYKIGGQSYRSQNKVVDNLNNIEDNEKEVNTHICRYLTVENIRKMINYNRVQDYTNALATFNTTLSLLNEEKKKNNNDLINGIIKNLYDDSAVKETNNSQVYLAISNIDYFKKWGEFYLDQLSGSLNKQIKPNFKDAACAFGGEIFEEIVDKASDIFDTLPPPTPSLLNRRSIYNNNATSNYSSNYYPNYSQRAPINMAAFNNAGGGCFDINSKISMADGSKKLAKDLKKDDLILTITKEGDYSISDVLCVVETKIDSKEREMCKIDELYITPWHPIKYNNEWVFPENIVKSKLVKCESMITLVLKTDHILIVDDIPCISLGHNYKDSILNHSFYGTSKVIEFLSKQDGWNNGHIILEDIYLKYEKNNNEVINIIYEKNAYVSQFWKQLFKSLF